MQKNVKDLNYGLEETPPRVSEIKRIFKSMFSRWIVTLGAIIFALLICAAVFAPWIAPYNPNKQVLRDALLQPSSEHILGTDELGRDVFSRIIYGSRVSLMVGLIVTSIAGILGTLLGLIAGYSNTILNNIIMRIMDAMMAIPGLILALAIGTALGGGLKNIMISIGISLIPGYCRLMCAQVLTVKENDYVMAANSLGAKYDRILLRHILPNSFPPLLVLVTFNMGTAILAEAGLSYLGIGISPPDAAWGSMVSGGYTYLLSNPLLSIAPGIAIILVVVALNLVGDGLRDALDPRLRGIV
jgi:ABC-type dipeptide/oligopeptide/nickel transport system permease subunit